MQCGAGETSNYLSIQPFLKRKTRNLKSIPNLHLSPCAYLIMINYTCTNKICKQFSETRVLFIVDLHILHGSSLLSPKIILVLLFSNIKLIFTNCIVLHLLYIKQIYLRFIIPPSIGATNILVTIVPLCAVTS